jgi:pseudouridine kinase
VLDRHLHLLGPAVPATSNPARASSSPGGVARNVAENLALVGARVRLVSRVGDDEAGREVLRALARRGVDVTAVVVDPSASTAQYVAVLDPAGDLVIGVAAMDVFDRISAVDLDVAWPDPGEWLFADCDLPAPVIASALTRARRQGTPVAVDAVSTPKVVRLAAAGLEGVSVLFCNSDEARALLSAMGTEATSGPEGCAAALVAAGATSVVLTMGARGALLADTPDVTRVRLVPAVATDVVDVTGAGDALVGTALARLASGSSLDDAVRVGVRAAALTVATPLSVRPDLAARLAVASLT